MYTCRLVEERDLSLVRAEQDSSLRRGPKTCRDGLALREEPRQVLLLFYSAFPERNHETIVLGLFSFENLKRDVKR